MLKCNLYDYKLENMLSSLKKVSFQFVRSKTLTILFEFIYYTGCVEVVGCVKGDELASWEMVPKGVGYCSFIMLKSIGMRDTLLSSLF